MPCLLYADEMRVASDDNTEGSPEPIPALRPHEKSGRRIPYTVLLLVFHMYIYCDIGEQLSDSAYISMDVSEEATASKYEDEAPLSEADNKNGLQGNCMLLSGGIRPYLYDFGHL